MTQIGIAGRAWRVGLVVFALGAVVLAGCDRGGVESGAGKTADVRPASAWHSVGDADSVVAIDDGAVQSELDAAIAQARQTMDEARERFAAATAEERRTWLIAWAAPLADDPGDVEIGRVEYVWVLPINWSPFRVEGVLISQPVRELACGKAKDEIVSFPVDELADWYCGAGEGDQSEQSRGGFTLAPLRLRFGDPLPSSQLQR